MDAAERWLRKNDPDYARRQKILRKKKQEKRDFYKNIDSYPPRHKYKKFPKGD